MTDFVMGNSNEQKAIEYLRMRMKNTLSPEMYDDSILFYRFLKARDFDVDKAEAMLRKHLKWRKVFQVDSILETFEPREVFQKYFAPQFIALDKDGDLVIYAPVGCLESRGNYNRFPDLIKCMKMTELEKHSIHFMEQNISLLKKENEKSGRNCYQGNVIIDLDQLTFGNATFTASVEIALRTLNLLQDNYPENLKAAFVINAPSYYVFIYSILKRIMSRAMLQKIQVFGRTGWKEVFLKRIDASGLPAFLGGNRTDPDGNPLCLTFMHHGSKIAPKNYLTAHDRWFKAMSIIKKTIVPPLSKNTISVDVKQYGSWIHWEFECKSKDIDFGLFFQGREHEIEVIPLHRFITSDGTVTGSYKTESVGKYIVIFDNSSSWLSSKEVHYTVNVVSPGS